MTAEAFLTCSFLHSRLSESLALSFSGCESKEIMYSLSWPERQPRGFSDDDSYLASLLLIRLTFSVTSWHRGKTSASTSAHASSFFLSMSSTLSSLIMLIYSLAVSIVPNSWRSAGVTPSSSNVYSLPSVTIANCFSPASYVIDFFTCFGANYLDLNYKL